MADIITIPMQPLNIYGELVTENGIEVKNAATISVGTDTITIPMQQAGYGSVLITVKLCPFPIPAISADKTAGCAPLQVAFSSTASEFLVSQLWTLGPGVTSADENPSYEYTAGGDYTVDLYGYNQAGSKQDSTTIHVLNPPIAGLSASATAGTAPLAIDFTAVCTGDIDNYDWDFGDGATSGDQNPSHEYSAGTYDVSLIASNPYCSDEIVLADYIVVEPYVPEYPRWEQHWSDWTASEGSWSGGGWVGGQYGAIIINVSGSWAQNYRPTMIRITYTGTLYSGYLYDTDSSLLCETVGSDPAGNYLFQFGNYDIGQLQFQGDGLTITNIEFYVEG